MRRLGRRAFAGAADPFATLREDVVLFGLLPMTEAADTFAKELYEGVLFDGWKMVRELVCFRQYGAIAEID